LIGVVFVNLCFLNLLCRKVSQFLRLNGWKADDQLHFTEWASPNSEALRSANLLPSHTPKFHWLDIFEIWELVTISYSPITILQQATFAFKALTALLIARWWIPRLAWVSSTPPLSLRCAEAVTYRILKVYRFCFLSSEFQEKNGGSSCKTARLGISHSCEQKCDYIPPPLSITCCRWLHVLVN
jgi:hypothetical protein